MESIQAHFECNSNENNVSNNGINFNNDIASEDGVISEIAEPDLQNGCFDIPDSHRPSETKPIVINQRILANPPIYSPEQAMKIEIEQEDNKTNNGIPYNSDEPLLIKSNIPTNAFETPNNIPSEETVTHKISGNPSFKLGLNDNASNEEMCVQNIEDENVGRMVYNSREPLSMIMEGNSPVADVAPIIVIHHNQVHHHSEYSNLNNTVKTDTSKPKTDISILKSEIILPSKSKIPQGIRGVQGMPGGNRLYLTGLKKSTSLHSPISTAELSPRNQRFSEGGGSFPDQNNDIGKLSCVSTPMTHVSEAFDVRSKLLFLI